MTNCSIVPIPVPSQEKLHKQWCLFDQSDNIDFNEEVRKITGDDPAQYEKRPKDLEILSDLDPSATTNYIQRRAFEPLLKTVDLSPILEEELETEYENFGQRKRHTSQNRRHYPSSSQSKKITRVQQNVSVRRH